MKAFMVRTLVGFAAVDDTAAHVLRGVRIGEEVMVDVVRPRNIQFHRLYWAMIGKLADALDLPSDIVSDVLKIRTGHFTPVMTKSGLMKFPKSISFAAMSEGEFRYFFERCCREICFEWLPHMTGAALQRDLLQMMGVNWDEADDDKLQHQDAGGSVALPPPHSARAD